jgi:hypothetical protein
MGSPGLKNASANANETYDESISSSVEAEESSSILLWLVAMKPSAADSKSVLFFDDGETFIDVLDDGLKSLNIV